MDRRLRRNLKAMVRNISKGLADVTEADAIEFIHQPVSDYLRNKGLSELTGRRAPSATVGDAHSGFPALELQL